MNKNYEALAQMAFNDIFDAGKCMDSECLYIYGTGSMDDPYRCGITWNNCPRTDDLEKAMVPYMSDQLSILANNDTVMESIISALKHNDMESLGSVIDRNLF